MRNQLASLPPDQPDPDLLNRLFFVQQVCLILVVQITAVALCSHLSTGLSGRLPSVLTAMPALSAWAALLCAVALLLSEPGRSGSLVFAGQVVAALVACAAGTSLCERALYLPSALNALLHVEAFVPPRSPLSIAAPATFFLLALVILLVRTQHPVLSLIADTTATFLSLLVLMLLLESLFSIFAASPMVAGLTSPQTLLCIVLLTVVTVLRRSEFGILSSFLGYGMGSRIGRAVVPVLFVLPFLRELARARLVSAQWIPSPYVSAVLTSFGTIVSLALLFFFASYINRMQTEIQSLTLRDELTGLYNVRGFNLLAEQALLLSRRAKQDFGVLFIDLDNLKIINDHMGHSIGSATLVETAKLLNSTFRETDVIARIGGDEFVVAGQFDLESISASIDRLQACAASTCTDGGRRFALSFSLGYAAVSHPRDTVKDLLIRADQAMYDEKRQKKLFAAAG